MVRRYQQRDREVRLARFACWLGALVDVLAAVQLMLPSSATILGFLGLRFPGAAGVPAVSAAVLMLGFAAVLVWAQQKVVSRRAILLITLAVVLLLALANVVHALAGTLPFGAVIGPLAIQLVLIGLFARSYIGLVRQAPFMRTQLGLERMR